MTARATSSGAGGGGQTLCAMTAPPNDDANRSPAPTPMRIPWARRRTGGWTSAAAVISAVVGRSNAAAKTAAVANRSAATFCKAPSIAAATCTGTVGRTLRIGTGVTVISLRHDRLRGVAR